MKIYKRKRTFHKGDWRRYASISHSHFSINECLGNCKEQDQEEEGSEGAVAPMTISLWLLWLHRRRMGETEAGQGPQTSLVGALLSSDRILGWP